MLRIYRKERLILKFNFGERSLGYEYINLKWIDKQDKCASPKLILKTKRDLNEKFIFQCYNSKSKWKQ